MAESQKDSSEVVRLADYMPPEYLVDHTHLIINIIDETRVEVEGIFSMRRNEATKQDGEIILPPIVLNRGSEVKNLVSIDVDGVAIQDSEFGSPGSRINLPGRDGEFEVRVKAVLNPAENKLLSGLYKSGEILVTQMESIGFRNLIPFPDRPDVLSSWSTELTANKERYPNLLATGDLSEDKDNLDGTHTAKSESEFKMPSYLYAAVAGKFACSEDLVNVDGDDINLQIYAEPQNIGRTKIAMDALKMAMQVDMDLAGRKYPLKDFKLVATDYFNFGAMENFGLNVFNSANILGESKVTLDDVMLNIALTVAHEYFHTWRGDLVTCRSWHEIALKEGFVRQIEAIFQGELMGHESAKISTVKRLRALQFAEDASSTAHPILQDEYVGDPMNGMYTVTTYDKGREVIGMIKTMIGDEAFRAGTDKYFKDFEGKAATLHQLTDCFQSVSGIDFTQFRNWFSQVGTPVCDVASAYEEATQTFSLTVKQKCPKAPFNTLNFPMVMGLVGPDGKAVPLELATSEAGQEGGTAGGHDLNRGILNITKDEETFVFKNVPKGTVPSLLRNFSAPVKLDYDYSADELLHLIKNDEDGFNRYDSVQRIAKNEINNLLQQRKEGKSLLVVNESTLAAYENVLNNTVESNPALAADMLILPGDSEIVQDMEIYDFEAAKDVRKTLQLAIATKFQARLTEIYNQYKAVSATEEDRADAPALNVGAIKARKVKNVCLQYLGAIKGPEETAIVKAQFETATNMSDEYTALNLLADIPAEKEAALKKFYEKWKHEPLVINQWIKAVATVDDENVIKSVRGLMMTDDCKDATPSRLNALFTFGLMRNYTHLHDISGEGYALAVDASLFLKNGQVGSRVIKEAFSDLPKMDEQRQNLMREQLRRLLATNAAQAGSINIAKKILGEK